MDKALLININWHHAVNDQSKLNQTVKDLDDGNKNTKIQAIEADNTEMFSDGTPPFS